MPAESSVRIPDPIVVSRNDEAAEETRAAIDDLRDLAHGIYPAVLADEGLAAAIEALAERTSIPIVVVAIPEQRFPRPVEAAAYFLVAEASGPIAASIGARAATVEVTRDRGRLLVEVIENGGAAPTPSVERSLSELSDRVGALDGRLWTAQTAGRGITIRAEIPCGS